MAKYKFKAFLPLILAGLFAFLSPPPASAQELNAWVYAERGGSYFDYYVGNQDDVPIAIFALNLTFWADYNWFVSPRGWTPLLTAPDSIVWIASPGWEIYSGQVLCCFRVDGLSYDDTLIDYQLVGIWPGTDQGKAGLGKIWGHSN